MEKKIYKSNEKIDNIELLTGKKVKMLHYHGNPEGILYYCPDSKNLYIFQNIASGCQPVNFNSVKKQFDYEYSYQLSNGLKVCRGYSFELLEEILNEMFIIY